MKTLGIILGFAVCLTAHAEFKKEQIFIGLGANLQPICLETAENEVMGDSMLFPLGMQTYDEKECSIDHSNDSYSFIPYDGTYGGQSCQVILAKNQQTGTQSIIFKSNGTMSEKVYDKGLIFDHLHSDNTSQLSDNEYREIPILSQFKEKFQIPKDCGSFPCNMTQVKSTPVQTDNIISVATSMKNSYRGYLFTMDVSTKLDVSKANFEADISVRNGVLSFDEKSTETRSQSNFKCTGLKEAAHWSGKKEITATNLLANRYGISFSKKP